MSMISPQLLSELAQRFDIAGHVEEVSPFGSGHINDSYRVVTASGGTVYLLQRINHHVFPDVAAVMRNMEVVTAHLRKKYQTGEGLGPYVDEKVLTIIPTREGELFFQDNAGNFWRMFVMLANTRSYDIVQTSQQAKEGGRAFGQFQRLLSDLDASLIHEVLVDFHHIGKRLEKLWQVVKADAKSRVVRVDHELAFVEQRAKRMHTILDMASEGLLPLRITHNDTKFNNVLLDANDKAQCVIDLDTVMPGYVAYDFGDAIRTIINRAAEDEANLEKIQLNTSLFKAFTEGYFEEAHAFLTQAEVMSLIEGVLLLPYMQGVRFLTDFLEGDQYFKIHHPDHNLQRARAQLMLVERLETAEQELKDMISQVTSRVSVG